MNKYVKEYKQIVNELIRKSFPSLKNRKIRIREYGKWAGPYYILTLGLSSDWLGTHTISLNKKLRGSKKEVLIGLFVHELCHQEWHKNNSKAFFKDWINGIKYMTSQIFGRGYSKEIERQTDIETIKKGYGKQLLKINELRKKTYSKKRLELVYKRGYLSPEEIKQYMKKFKNQRNLKVK